MDTKEQLIDGIEKALREVAPPDLRTELDKVNATRESKYIPHESEVVVFEVRSSDIPLIDSIPGTFMVDVVQGDLDENGKVLSVVTPNGQRKVHMYKVVISLNPSAVPGGEYVIVPRKEWDASMANKGVSMMTNAQEMAGLIQRSGGVGDEV